LSDPEVERKRRPSVARETVYLLENLGWRGCPNPVVASSTHLQHSAGGQRIPVEMSAGSGWKRKPDYSGSYSNGVEMTLRLIELTFESWRWRFGSWNQTGWRGSFRL